uniref:LrgB-like protein n=1 Tax=Colletotrichum fructicola (strain Nara gc5) TaxID=1213859 RepID=L2FSD1_COLFN
MVTNLPARRERLSFPVFSCLRHFTDNALASFHAPRLPSRMFRRGDDDDISFIWGSCWRSVVRRVGVVAWVGVIYLTSELLVWSLSLALRPVGLQFLSSIAGMALVFAAMVVLQTVCPGADGFYHRNIKSKIDFINNNLGVAFPVPIVTISRQDLLGGAGIGRVITNFATTNVIFWTLAFLLCWAVLTGIARAPSPKTWVSKKTEVDVEQPWRIDTPTPRLELPPQTNSRRPSESTTLNGTTMTGYHTDKEAGLAPDSRTNTQTSTRQPPEWIAWTRECYPIILAIFFLVAMGIPISRSTGDDRILDGCMLWLTWISSTRAQRTFGRGHLLAASPGIKTTATTLLNPVLLTTLAMTAYTRAKAAATHTPADTVLAAFSLSDLWTAKTTGWSLRPDQRDWFGAGDAALSILECGIVVWGFKLYECRWQIWSRAGFAVVLMSAGVAGLNVFVCVLLGRAVGLNGPEAFAFAARSTTLALARPAMEVLEGNQVVNAALVVSNGILGQLMYPFLLRRLGLEGQEKDEGREEAKDSALTIAAGTAIGINGAAMGVSYLYERKNRAAPYAALSMTVFGIMTVVFTAVDPFTGILLRLAS